ncbi:DNA cytosine methyltransferase [Bifidobacterium mellis]|uniref:DNA (cytosine-5-)-methyltransferase n=1 Tax=Bifidobacterium mellis TaxID=1293823 RepID=A0A0F4KWH7_9BIFI|nr:DNA cytosine methyltransferase [Bifidobacterium mellis]KJY50389.1 Cytosine methyl transferase, RM methylase bbrUIIM [Bifidobacterium mellis]
MLGKSRVEAIDLFCGTGGLSLGLKQGGINIIAGIDNADACEYPYKYNLKAKFIKASVADITGADLNQLWNQSEIRLLAGCAPCQPFSSQRRGADTRNEKAWPLLKEFGRLVDETHPEFVTMENVPNISSSIVFNNFVNTLKSLGYTVKYTVLYGPDYGLPQKRKRLVLLAGLGYEVQLPKPKYEKNNYHTVYDAIHDLPSLASGERDPNDPLHAARNLTPLNLKRLRASRPGGTWLDWPEELRLNCQKTEKGKTFKSFYGRMRWDEPSPTITTQFYNPGAGRFTHPEQDRSLTLREASRLQGFPDSYIFNDPNKPIVVSTIGKLIGNAVPPVFGDAIAHEIIKALNSKENN